jgi:hypothetical protein
MIMEASELLSFYRLMPESNRCFGHFWNTGQVGNALAALALVFYLFLSPVIASAQTATHDSRKSPVPASASGPANASAPQLTVISELGKAGLGLQDTKLLAHHRSTDPFAVPIRGKFRGLPPALVQKPVTAGVSAPAAAPTPPPPTLAMAVQQLPVGAVNPNGREMLVGPRLVREGDLLVLELSGHRFVAWVESIDERGAQFCDLEFKQRTLRPLRTRPKGLESDAVEQHPDIHSFLQKNGQ